MPVTKPTPDDTIWSIRGVSENLIKEVKITASKKGLNIGQLVEMSLKKFFDEEAGAEVSATPNDKRLSEIEARLEAKIEEKIEAKLKARSVAKSKLPTNDVLVPST